MYFSKPFKVFFASHFVIELGVKGLETDTPILQLDGMIFQGSWEHVIGTRLFFEPNGEGNAEYRCKTMKKIVFKQGQLVPITSSKTATETETTTKTSTSTDMATEQST
jgi:hypothetical protein